MAARPTRARSTRSRPARTGPRRRRGRSASARVRRRAARQREHGGRGDGVPPVADAVTTRSGCARPRATRTARWRPRRRRRRAARRQRKCEEHRDEDQLLGSADPARRTAGPAGGGIERRAEDELPADSGAADGMRSAIRGGRADQGRRRPIASPATPGAARRRGRWGTGVLQQSLRGVADSRFVVAHVRGLASTARALRLRMAGGRPHGRPPPLRLRTSPCCTDRRSTSSIDQSPRHRPAELEGGLVAAHQGEQVDHDGDRVAGAPLGTTRHDAQRTASGGMPRSPL